MTRTPILATTGTLSLAFAAVLALTAGCGSMSRFDAPGGAQFLYEARCGGSCHVTYAPGDVHPDDWPAIVDEMGPRAGLNQKYRSRVTDYVVAASTRAWQER